MYTRNSSIDEIVERYCLNHAIVVKLYQPYTQLARNVRLSQRLFWRIVTFGLLRLITTVTYLLRIFFYQKALNAIKILK